MPTVGKKRNVQYMTGRVACGFGHGWAMIAAATVHDREATIGAMTHHNIGLLLRVGPMPNMAQGKTHAIGGRATPNVYSHTLWQSTTTAKALGGIATFDGRYAAVL
jgi:hypothetical protein